MFGFPRFGVKEADTGRPFTLRRWIMMALALLLVVFFFRSCVRFVPADAPPTPAIEAAKSRAVSNGPLLIPVEGVPASALTDTFTQARAGGEKVHDAIDIMAAQGRAVLAAADGRVEKIFWSEAGGRTLYERSADGAHVYYYAHLDHYAPGLREGQPLTRGQRIATLGSTGNASPDAPHLHFAVSEVARGRKWYDGRAINPYPLLAKAR